MASPLPSVAESTESARLAALRAADILDSGSEAGFDTIARLAAKICEVPIGLVNFVDADRLWVKANCGLPGVSNVPREHGMCGRTIHETALVEFPDMLADDRFADNPLVHDDPQVRFYAGVPLVTSAGYAIGTLCVLDYVPHRLSVRQREEMAMLAELVVELIATRLLVPPSIRQRLNTLSAAAEHSGSPIVIYANPQSGTRPPIIYANRSFLSTFGYAADEVIGKTSEYMLGPASNATTTAAVLAGMQSGISMDEEFVVYDRARVPHLVDMHTRPVPGDDGSISAWVVTLRDITEQRAASQLFVQQAERIRALYAITNMRDETGLVQFDAALALGVADLRLDYGFVARCENDSVTFLSSVGAPARQSTIPKVVPLRDTWLQEALAANDVRAYDDLGDPASAPAGAPAHPGWGSYIVAPLNVFGNVYGVVGFSGTARGNVPFSDTDREFVRLIGALVGSALERKAQRDELDSLPFSDALTGLANRAMLFDRLESALRASRRYLSRFAIHYLDLDGFKSVNDRSGHAAGDAVLQTVAARLLSMVRESDTVARIGGDEFVIVQTEIDRDSDAAALAERITNGLSVPFVVESETFALGASVGVARYPGDGETVRDLLAAADLALYRAKAVGKGKALFA